MTEDEQRFWDAAFVAYAAAVVSDPSAAHLSDEAIAECASVVDAMLEERRKRTQKTSTSA